MIDQLLVCSALLTSSPSAQALGMVNQTCISDSFKSYKDLYQKTASFVGDNRTLLEKDGARFGASQKINLFNFEPKAVWAYNAGGKDNAPKI